MIKRNWPWKGRKRLWSSTSRSRTKLKNNLTRIISKYKTWSKRFRILFSSALFVETQ